MRKLIVLLWVFLLSITSAIAQSSDENKEVYDQLKEWAVAKLTIAYMEDLYLFTPDEKGNRGSEQEYKTYKKLHTDYTIFKEDVNLDSISELLKKGAWSSASKDQFLKYKNELFNSEYNNFRNIIYVPSGIYEGIPIKKSNRKKALAQIIDHFISLSQKNEETTIVEVGDNHTEESKNNEIPIQTTPTTTKNETLFSFVLKIFIGFLLVISLFFNYKLKKNIKIIRKEIDRSNSLRKKNSHILTQTKQELFSKNNEIVNLKEKLIKIEDTDRISDNYSSNYPSNERMSEIIPEIISETIELEVSKQHLSEIIYLSSPFQNLTFANEDASKEKTLNSLYLVEFDKQMQTGELSVMVDADLSRALNSPDSYLETACTYDNEYFNNARAIQVTEKGEIKLDGDDWNVTKKVKIKFI
tara:strand:+ start:574 stop:1812 length:1239 start_codon:yes stop_codon:yes gene_type:complete